MFFLMVFRVSISMATCRPILRKRWFRRSEILLLYVPSEEEAKKFEIVVELKDGRVLLREVSSTLGKYDLPYGINAKDIKKIGFVKKEK